jgi:hypothetical protein
MSVQKLDVAVENHGSVVMVNPITRDAVEWVSENVAVESWAWLGRSFAVDPRYVDDLISGMVDFGLVVKCV